MASASSGDNDQGADEVSVNSVVSFLRRTDGKARHADLVHHFRKPLTHGDPRVKGKSRQEFRDILQRVTAIKTENGEKYVILTKAGERVDKLPPPAPRKTPRSRQDIDQSAPTFTHLNAVLGSQGHRDRSSVASLGAEDENANAHGGPSPTLTNRSSVSGSYSDSGLGSELQSVSDTSSLGRHVTSKSTESLDSDATSQSGGQDLDDLGLDYFNEFSAEDKQWMLCAAFGNIDRLKKILEKSPEMISKRDSVTGAAIHWGAKLGRKDIVQLMIEKGVDKNIRTGACGERCASLQTLSLVTKGHTALHLAAMHGHDTILIVLIDTYHVNKDIRDYSGKKAKDLVKQTVAADIQRKLGRSLILDRTLHVDRGVIKRSDSWTTFGPNESPRSTPEPQRRKDRSKSFLKKKKKPFVDSYGAPDKDVDDKKANLFMVADEGNSEKRLSTNTALFGTRLLVLHIARLLHVEKFQERCRLGLESVSAHKAQAERSSA